ncbi:unnamed protein product [Sphagnum troendelagicum]|uniref:Intraflagellar transport protein 52 n=1 Tax=Sphagnum troendelagicum TaxID=128251 RepID=A0ABP0U1X2_9BRYO
MEASSSDVGGGTFSTGMLPIILFDCCKHETHTPGQGFKQMVRRLRGSYRVISNKEELSLEILKEGSVVVFGCPTERFTTVEVDAVKGYVHAGGCVLLLSAQGGDARHQSNLNELLHDFGITINSDSLVRVVQEKYLHPKEVLISNSVLCKEINHVNETCKVENNTCVHRLQVSDMKGESTAKPKSAGMQIVYPYGATLSTQRPAAPILASGLISFPIHRPLGAIYEGTSGKGRIAVLGSTAIFEDAWLEKEDNAKLFDFLLLWLTHQSSIEVERINVEELDTGEFEHVPNTEALAGRLRCCLQEAEELPKDFTKLVDDELFQYHTNLIPSVVSLYEQLGVKHMPLTLITPQFETPSPPLQPAVFAPSLREPPPPAVDLFDLDDCFASPSIGLSHLTNKWKNAGTEDLQFYTLEGAAILGITPKVVGVADNNSREAAKAVLSFIFQELVNMKKLHPENKNLSPNP